MRAVLVLITLNLVGCATAIKNEQKKVTAGQIGCKPADIKIIEEGSLTVSHWTAECRGKRFICSEQSSSTDNQSAIYSCKEELK